MTAVAASSTWQRLAAAVVRPLRRQRLRRGHEVLDCAALRDLGLSRSELSSFQAEAAGIVDRTRRRVSAGTANAEPASRRNEALCSQFEISR
jgi:uncharacterized protein YjiS (DUF1127 family)